MPRILALLSLTLLAAACSQIPQEAYYNRGAPESLLDVSSEVVNIPLADPAAIGELSNYLNQDPPTRVELGCSQGAVQCSEAQGLLRQMGVPYTFTDSAGGNAVLHYERVVARDCNQRYIDNSINPYNLNHPSFGCSVAGNIVQMTSDKTQLVSPNTLENLDAEKASQIYREYITAKPQAPTTASASGTILGK